MSFILKHKRTGCYLQGSNQWTSQMDYALQFSSGMKLVDYIERSGVHERADAMEIIVCNQSTPAVQSSLSRA